MVSGTNEQEHEKGVAVGAGNKDGGDLEDAKEDHGASVPGPVGRHLRTMAEANAYLADLSCYPGLANWLAGQAREEEARRLRRSIAKKRKALQSQVTGEGEGSCELGRNEVSTPANGVLQRGVVVEGAQRSTHLQIDTLSKSEDAGAQQQKVAEDAQGSANLGKYAVSKSESAVIRQHHVDGTGKGDIGNNSGFGGRTEPTGDDLKESAAVIDLCFSCSDNMDVTVDMPAEGAKMNAETDDFDPKYQT